MSPVVKLTCPKCGRRGQVTWTPKQGLKPQADDLSEGFIAVEASSKARAQILCAKCKVPAEER